MPAGRRRISPDVLILGAGLVVLAAWLVLAVALPLWTLLGRSFENGDGLFIGLDNYIAYFSRPNLRTAIWNSVGVSLLVAAITVPLALGFAYALTRSAMPGKTLFRVCAMIPVLAPSLLPAISFVYLFGNQGLIKGVLLGQSVYGPIGIVMGEVFYCFPHALIILVVALSTADARLYEAAAALGASRTRIFFTVTLPGIRYGLISALVVVFTLVITDFGIPKVIGGQFSMLATEVYKQVIGQQNFPMGAVIGVLLLLPALLAFAADRMASKRQQAQLTASAVPLEPKPDRRFDLAMLGYCTLISALLVGVLGVAVWASLIKFWPYNLSLTLAHYDFSNADPAGWSSYWNSLKMASLAALIGTAIIFPAAYVMERSPPSLLLAGTRMLALMPLAVPGLVLGLGYLLFYNAPSNPLTVLYGTLAILVLNTVAHFYTVAHLTASTAVKQLDPAFEAVSATLKVSLVRTFRRVTAVVCLPAILEIGTYLFVNAMTTVSAVMFLYVSETKLASVAIVNMEDAANTAAASAMSVLIVATSAAAKLLQSVVSHLVDRRTQAWRRR